jgi:leucine dehydrogenase
LGCRYRHLCALRVRCNCNQLAVEEKHGKALIEKGIIYAPDFLINAGGLMNVCAEIGTYNRALVTSSVEKIYDRLLDCLQLADNKKITAQEAAMQMAKERLSAMKDLKSRL